jgi:glycosyltransferase involved in cell wall biosynthesis
MIRVLHLFNSFQVGGVERLHAMLVEDLCEDFAQVCWAYHPGQLVDELSSLGVSTVCSGFAEVAPAVAGGEFDCVVMRTHRHIREFLKLLGRTMTPLIYIKDYLRWFQGNDTFWDRDFDGPVHGRANKIFYCGPSLRRGLDAMGIQGRDPEMLNHGLRLERFPLRPKTLSRQGFLTVGILANLLPIKNQLAAIHAMRAMLASGEAGLVLGGDFHNHEYTAALRRSAAGLPVTFTGYVADVPSFLDGLDVLMLTSNQEGWPVALMEGMACGLPVIAPALGDVPELLDYGRAGLLFPPSCHECIPGLLRRLAEPGEYARFAAASVERVRRFDAAASAEKVRKAVTRLACEEVCT